MHCFYEPWSRCTIQDALAGTGHDVNGFPTIYTGDIYRSFLDESTRQELINKYSSSRGLNIIYTTGHGTFDAHFAIPTAMQRIIDCSPIRKTFRYYWWRALSATFILRPNEATLGKLAEFSTLPLHDRDNCVAMFVRHGDKGIEMKLIPFSRYVEVVQMMFDRGLIPGSANAAISASAASATTATSSGAGAGAGAGVAEAHRKSNISIFVSTDDPDVITEATDWAKQHNAKLLYTNLFDRATQTARLDWNSQHKKGTKAVHDENEYLSMLLNLAYSLRCEAWVCTLASNSCRLIDELRVTIGAKANRHFADLSAETCEEPPCIGSGIYNFGE